MISPATVVHGSLLAAGAAAAGGAAEQVEFRNVISTGNILAVVAGVIALYFTYRFTSIRTLRDTNQDLRNQIGDLRAERDDALAAERSTAAQVEELRAKIEQLERQRNLEPILQAVAHHSRLANEQHQAILADLVGVHEVLKEMSRHLRELAERRRHYDRPPQLPPSTFDERLE